MVCGTVHSVNPKHFVLCIGFPDTLRAVPAYSLRQLEYLVAVAEYGSVSGAAKALHTSQSALSSGISEMERALGLQLLVRHHAKGVTLTSAGERLLARARNLLDDAVSLEQDARNLVSAPVGAVTLGVFHVIAAYVLPGLISVLDERYPDVQLRVEEVGLDALNEGVLSGRFEVGIGYDLGRARGVAVQRLAEVSAHVVMPAGHRLASRKSVSLRDVAHDPVVLLDLPFSRDYFSSVWAAAGVEPDVRYRATSADLVRAMVGRGLGVALLNMRPRHTFTVDGNEVALVDIKDAIPPAHVVAMTLEGARLTRRTEAVIEAASASARS